MEKTRPDRWSFRKFCPRRLASVGLSLLLVLAPSGTALGQQAIPVGGTVTSASGAPLRGVTVQVVGTDTRTQTDAAGKYALTAPSNGILSFSLLGQRAMQTNIGGRTTIDVRMDPVAFLDQVVVTAYTEQRRADITGAVAGVNVETANRQTTASVLQKLDATVSGVRVENSGSPGSRSTVRIRGVSSFQNNDPLYVVDGTPVQDDYVNFLNPNDITSIQVLKDASASSIYGSRASNGVIVIETTKKGVSGPPRTTLRVRTGLASPTRGYDDFLILNSMDYYEIVRRSYVNAKEDVPTNVYGDPSNPSVPQYIWPNNCGPLDKDGAPTPGPCSNVDEGSYLYPSSLIMPGSAGTNWWKTVFGTGYVGDYNLDVSGGGTENTYSVSFNFFDQKGTAAYNTYKRGSVRANTAFNRGRFSFGENLAIAADRVQGINTGNDDFGEGGFLGKNILSQPVVPVYDVKGNFASGKAVTLGNNTNPLKAAYEARNDFIKNGRIFGNIFGGFNAVRDVTVQSRFGFNLGQTGQTRFTAPNPENSEPTFGNQIFENTNQFTDWTWTNTARLVRTMFSQHRVDLLLGQEANEGNNRYIEGQMNNVISSDVDSRYIQDVLGDAASKNVLSRGGRYALLSFFGKADYSFADKYVASFTVRRDGSSRLGPSHRWGTFPAVGLGWRVSKEPFLANSHVVNDLMLRAGWGKTGNQLIPPGRVISQFGGGRGDTYYDVGGTNSGVVSGFRPTAIGNLDLKWEENTSTNIGADATLFDGRLDLVVDVYQRETNNLLFQPPIPGTEGVADAPFVNIGKMQNKGIDFSIGHRSAFWNVTLNGSRYSNEIVRIDGVQTFFYGPISTRYGNQVINMIGHPIGAFYGYIADGMFRDAADVAAHATQDGAAPGRIKFRDVNGDGQVTLADRTVIGSPHPDFTAGLDLGMRWKAWDLSATVFGTFGNEIFDVQKEFYVFRNFSTNVRKDLLTDSWTPVDPNVPRAQYVAANPGAKYPILEYNDNYSHQISSFYVEDGSYVRLRSLQVGYNIPPSMSRWFAGSRVYLQAENLFTFTGYDGLDPAVPASYFVTNNGTGADQRDQYRGIDRGVYPSSRVFSIGIVTNF